MKVQNSEFQSKAKGVLVILSVNCSQNICLSYPSNYCVLNGSILYLAQMVSRKTRILQQSSSSHLQLQSSRQVIFSHYLMGLVSTMQVMTSMLEERLMYRKLLSMKARLEVRCTHMISSRIDQTLTYMSMQGPLSSSQAMNAAQRTSSISLLCIYYFHFDSISSLILDKYSLLSFLWISTISLLLLLLSSLIQI